MAGQRRIVQSAEYRDNSLEDPFDPVLWNADDHGDQERCANRLARARNFSSWEEAAMDEISLPLHSAGHSARGGFGWPFEGMRKEHFSWLAANYESSKALLGMYVGVGEGRPAPKWAPELVRVTSD